MPLVSGVLDGGTTLTDPRGMTTITYDAQNRPTLITAPSGRQHELTYDNAGNVTDQRVRRSTSTSTDGMATTYAHDALGRLTAETAAAFTRTYNHQAGDSPSAITSTLTGPESSLTRTQRLTYGPGGLIESQLGSAAPTYPEADNVGTITAWIDEQESVTQEPELDPFGELVGPRPNSTPSPVDQSPLTFTGAFGRQSLAGADLVKMGARVYDPELGAFISRDPVMGEPAEPARRAPYAYAFNGPGRYLDLDGRSVIGDIGRGATEIVGWLPGKTRDWAVDVTNDPHADTLKKITAYGIGFLSSLATCENLGATVMAVLPGPGKLKKLGKAAEIFGAAANGVRRARALPELDGSGKVHGDLPPFVPRTWTPSQLREVATDLRKSIQTRKQRTRKFGEGGGHRRRIQEEERLLRQIEGRLGGS